jgi:hypothetical protein
LLKGDWNGELEQTRIVLAITHQTHDRHAK